jgi:transcriptional regulator with PAS, ATPase and Fis domain
MSDDANSSLEMSAAYETAFAGTFGRNHPAADRTAEALIESPRQDDPVQPPPSPDSRTAVEQALGLAPAKAEVLVEKMPEPAVHIPGVIAESASMQQVAGLVIRLRNNESPVFIRGESGVGKDVIARAIHGQSNRAKNSFIAVNCAALPEALLESELFGFVKGAFTGATNNKEGLFARADGGTLFLDEISEMAPALQSKLLRVLQDGRVRPIGATEDFLCYVRIIAATNQDMGQALATGTLRRDLYYRLNVIPIALEPLRDRREDIVPLAKFLIEGFDAERTISPAALEKLAAYDWPGNVRELGNVIERSLAMSPATILTPEDIWIDPLLHAAPEVRGIKETTLPDEEKEEIPDARRFCERAAAQSFTLRDVEDTYIQAILKRTAGNKTLAADLLGLNRTTLHRRLALLN